MEKTKKKSKAPPLNATFEGLIQVLQNLNSRIEKLENHLNINNHETS